MKRGEKSRLSLIILFSLFLSAESFAGQCSSILGSVSGLFFRGLIRPVGKYIVAPTGKALYYPAVVPLRVLEIGKSYKEGSLSQKFKEIVKKDALPFALFVTQSLIVHGMITTLHEMDDASDAEETDADKELVVYVNAFSDSEAFFHDSAESYFDYRYGGKKKAIYIQPGSMNEMFKQLAEIRKKHGPIKRLEYYGHATRWGLVIDHDGAGKNTLNRSLEKTQLDEVFDSGAKLVLNTCWLASDPEGREFTQNLGTSLLKKGGEVYSTKTTFVGSPSRLSTFLIQPLLLYRSVNELITDEDSTFTPLKKIQIDSITSSRKSD